MSSLAFINLFKKYPQMKVFHVNDLSLLLNRDKKALMVDLHRMVNKGIVMQLANGYYANPFLPPDNDYISMILTKPSYISMEMALNRHGILPQTVFTYTMITTSYTHRYRVLNVDYYYHHYKCTNFFGYEEKTGGILMADPEKAFLDFIYFGYYMANKELRYSFLSLVDDMNLSSLRASIFKQYSKKMKVYDYIEKQLPFILRKIGA